MEKKKKNFEKFIVLGVIVVVIVVIFLFLSKSKNLELTFLEADCDDCFDISMMTVAFKDQFNLTPKTKTIKGDEALAMAKKYKITKLPAAILSGDIDDLELPAFNKTDDVLVFDQTLPPYYDLKTETVIGKVKGIQILDKTCTDCFNVSQIVTQLKQVGVFFEELDVVDASDEKGKELIEKYKIEKLPTLVFDKEILNYPMVKTVWANVGSEEEDGSLVLRFLNPPYKDLTTGEIEGLVHLLYLTDKSCTECYNYTAHKVILEQMFSVQVASEDAVDISDPEGQLLVKTYNIDSVPTVIVSKNAAIYPEFDNMWLQVGTKEVDGNYVFRKVAQLGPVTFRNLTSNKIVKVNVVEEE